MCEDLFEDFDELIKDFKDVTNTYIAAIKKSAEKHKLEVVEVQLGNYDSLVKVVASTNGEFDIDFRGMVMCVRLSKSIYDLEVQDKKAIDGFIEDCEYCTKCERGYSWLNMYFPFGIVENFLRYFGILRRVYAN